MLFEELLFQTLQRIELLDPWEPPDGQCGQVDGCLLAGGVVLCFDHHALLCTSPLRYMHCQSGTMLDGVDSMHLGYRITLIDLHDVDLLAPRCLRRHVISPLKWLSTSTANQAEPMLLFAFMEQGHQSVSLALNILGCGCYSLTYRPDLDGSIQFGPQGQASQVGHVTVKDPCAMLGYLHPRSAHPFVIDDSYRAHAALNGWPLEVRKQSVADATGQTYRFELKKLLLARFRQHVGLRRRLLALRCAVTVSEVPEGLIEEIAADLQQDRID
jgi:hypothetical protein